MSQYTEAIESKYAALRAVEWLIAQPETAAMDPFGARMVRYARGPLISSDVFSWEPEILRAVIESSKTIPADTSVLLRELPASGWMWFGDGIDVTEQNTRGLLWFVFKPLDSEEPHLAVYGFEGPLDRDVQRFMGPLSTVPTAQFNARLGVSIDELVANPTGASVEGLIRLWVAATIWLEQRIIVASGERPDRACRRRLERGNLPVPGLKVIHLRRAETAAHGVKGPGGGIHYSCQWIVRGHWRQQFYPSVNQRRPQWIMPYVKGPEDAPLRTPSPTVFAVTR